MRTILVLLLTSSGLLLSAFSCNKQEHDNPGPGCGTPATIRNFKGLDGCGYLLVLDNGKRLEPADTLWGSFPKVEGKRVTISYAPATGKVSACMTGELVNLRCIQPMPADSLRGGK